MYARIIITYVVNKTYILQNNCEDRNKNNKNETTVEMKMKDNSNMYYDIVLQEGESKNNNHEIQKKSELKSYDNEQKELENTGICNFCVMKKCLLRNKHNVFAEYCILLINIIIHKQMELKINKINDVNYNNVYFKKIIRIKNKQLFNNIQNNSNLQINV